MSIIGKLRMAQGTNGTRNEWQAKILSRWNIPGFTSLPKMTEPSLVQALWLATAAADPPAPENPTAPGRAPPPPAQLGSHSQHFQPSANPPDAPGYTEDKFEIHGWEVFVTGQGESTAETTLYAPIITSAGVRICASNRVYCILCEKWLSAGADRATIGHYTEHLRRHAARLAAFKKLTDPSGTPWAVLKLVLQEGKPASLLRWFRKQFPQSCDVLPQPESFRNIMKLVRDDLERRLFEECRASEWVALSMDG